MDNSDYTKPRTRIDKLLPRPYQSDIGESFMENTVNRLLTKKETTYVDGYVGAYNSDAINSRQIVEDSIAAQANQLQPVITTTLGSEKRYMTWNDILNELKLQGVDISKFSEWGRTEKYNWVPPVDIDKVIHYQDYFWVDANPNSTVEYITIKNNLNIAKAKLSNLRKVIDRYSDSFNVVELLQKIGSNRTLPINSTSAVSNHVRVSGNHTDILKPDVFFNITNSTSNAGVYDIISASYDANTDVTTIVVDNIQVSETIGTLVYNQFNGIVIDDDVTQLFERDFVFFIKNSNNLQLNNEFFKVESSTLRSGKTYIVINKDFTDSRTGGAVSLAEEISVLEGKVQCEEGDTIAFDNGLWDDNPINPLWNGDFDTLLNDITKSAPPTDGFGSFKELWYHNSTTQDSLYQYDADGKWKLLYNAFSLLLEKVTGSAFFDFSEPCASEVSPIEQQWSDNNKWVHRTDVENFASARQAAYPIIEFFSGLELNEYIEINHTWAYRNIKGIEFAETDNNPKLIELIELDDVTALDAHTLVLDSKYGNLVNEFKSGFTFADNNNEIFTVEKSEFAKDTSTGYWRTVLTVSEDLINVQSLHPVKTTLGDTWIDYDQHWLYVGVGSELPVANIQGNVFSDDEVDNPTITTNPDYDYIENKYSQKFIVKDNSNKTFLFTTSNLRERILVDSDDLRVYVNGKRQYGSYSEVPDTADSKYVRGVEFFNTLQVTDIVVLYVDTASVAERGYLDIAVRQELSDVEFDQSQTLVNVSVVGIKKIEQIKSEKNQYPRFNLFATDGTTANKTSNIFAYKTDSSNAIARHIGLRIVVDNASDFQFEQFLLSDSGGLYAYKETVNNLYVVDTNNNQVFKKVNFVLSDVFVQGNKYGVATVSNTTPNNPYDGQVWFNTDAQKLYEFSDGDFVQIDNVLLTDANPELKTIWRKSKNDYIPELRDWRGRTEDEYNTEKDEYIAGKIAEIITNDSGVSNTDASDRAESMWFAAQKHKLSLSGEWVGDWNIPDYMYFNVEAENRKVVSSKQLIGHFEDIINRQDKFPGFVGDKKSQFHLLTSAELDLGRGGKIHQYNNNFSTFISSIFVDNIVPIDLIEYAQNQYQIALEQLFSISKDSIVKAFTTKNSLSALVDSLTLNVNDTRLLNSNAAYVVGDSSAYDSETGNGVRNWMATLPILGLLKAVKPTYREDAGRSTYEVKHHDGHVTNYAIGGTEKLKLVDTIIDFYNSANFGTVAFTLPPELFSDLDNQHDLEKGYVWINQSTKKVYILNIDFIQDEAPAHTSGVFWANTSGNDVEVFVSDGAAWNAISATVGKLFSGNSIETSDISAWEEIDINNLVVQPVLDVENRLYSVSIEDKNILNGNTSNDLMEYFLRYTKERNIDSPYFVKYSPIDPFSWNYYESVVGIKFNWIGIDLSQNVFVLNQLASNSFAPNSSFYIKNAGDNSGTWKVDSAWENAAEGNTYVKVIETIESNELGIMYKGTLPSKSNTGAEAASYWKSLYISLYGTEYPNIEPWKLQGYDNQPDWWDEEYANDEPSVYGARRWKQLNGVGMWKNILTGVIPAGRDAPEKTVPKYSYVSVNIGDISVSADNVNHYAPDDVFPPYFDHTSVGPAITSNRSLYSVFNIEVRNPAAIDFYGNNGRTEYDWKISSQYGYDLIKNAYINDPINFIKKSFGFEYDVIESLSIDRVSGRAPSHKNTSFHGSLIDSVVQRVSGINQWYVNYNRYTNTDIAYSNFTRMWTKWNAVLAYQLSSFIDVRTLDISNKNITVENNIDYTVHVKKSSGIEKHSAHGITATLLSTPPKVVNRDNSGDWIIQVSNNSSRDNTLEKYDVLNFPFVADVQNNVMSIFSAKVLKVVEISKMLDMSGNITEFFKDKISINGNEYTIASAHYDTTNNLTKLLIEESVAGINVGDIAKKLDYKSIPWETGDAVFLSSEDKLPAPFFGDTPNIGPIQYFIIKVSDTEFRLAETRRTALANLPIDIVNSGARMHYIGELENVFIVTNEHAQSKFWRHYKLDKRYKSVIALPSIVNGMQAFIDIVDGYLEVLKEDGFDFSKETNLWQEQIESFIDTSEKFRNNNRNQSIGNSFSVVPDKQAGNWKYADSGTLPFTNGYPVNIKALTGGLPAPFLEKIAYYMIVNPDGTFNLASSVSKASSFTPVPLLDNGSANNIEIYAAVENTVQYPKIEVNAFKNSISFRPRVGIISDMVKGPFSDINVARSVIDQNGNPLPLSNYVVNRLDKITTVALTTLHRPDNSADLAEYISPENYLHISSVTFFIDTYEHIIEFKNYSLDGNLIYDSFVGLNLEKMNIDFNKQTANTKRPNIGGSAVVIKNQNMTTYDNLERMTDDLRYAYGDVATNESNRYGPYARSTLGYNIRSTEEYLDNIDINEKSQFLFWKGLIQVKGSTKSIDSFINSKKFIDANIDEFWAYQIAEFGSVEEKEYPEMIVQPSDITNSTAKYEFSSEFEQLLPGLSNTSFGLGGYDSVQVTTADNNGFNIISLKDRDRWVNQPMQLKTLENNGLVLYFEQKSTGSIDLDLDAIVATENLLIKHGFNTEQLSVLVEFDYTGTDSYTVTTDPDAPGFIANTKKVTLRNGYIPFTDQLTVYKNGVALDKSIDYFELNQIRQDLAFSDSITLQDELVAGDIIEVFYGHATLSNGRHYDEVNSNIVEFFGDEVFQVAKKVTLYNMQNNFEAHNASKIIDNKTGTVISSINTFDPAREIYNYQVLRDVDVITGTNPAKFFITEENIISRVDDSDTFNKFFWGKEEVGTVWADTSAIHYIPYYDDKKFRILDTRLSLWGKQAAYSEFKVYEWVESDVPPSEYDAFALGEQGNSDIPEHLRKSGSAKKTILEVIFDDINDTTDYVEIKNAVRDFDVAIDAVTSGNTGYAFTIDNEFLQSDIFGTDSMAVYVNGLIHSTLKISEVTGTVVLEGLKRADAVSFVINRIDVNDEVLNELIDTGLVMATYEYTVKTKIFDGAEIDYYYFWVADKLTRHTGKTVSPKQIENQWSQVTYPYIVFQGSEPARNLVASEQVTKDVSFEYNASVEHANDLSYLQENHTSVNYNGSGINGYSDGGLQYQPGDVLTMSNGATILVEATSDVGAVTKFVITYAGDEVVVDTELQVASVRDAGGDVPSVPGNGFTITPQQSNIGGFKIKLESGIADFNSLQISVQGRVLAANDSVAKTGSYIIEDYKNLTIFVNAKPNDIISIAYSTKAPKAVAKLPARYTQIVVKNIRNKISEQDRYSVRFRKDFINDSGRAVENKNKHVEWKLFREKQQFKIDQVLWNKVIEAISGKSLSDGSRIPEISRELYDRQYNTDTRFGLNQGQAFGDGKQMLNTILSDLNNPENEFRETNVSDFIKFNKFDSADNIVSSLQNMYSIFATDDINRIFFLVLHDALSKKKKYDKLFKTSMISIYGVKVLDTRDIFDE